MIIVPSPDGLLLVRQPDHAGMSAAVASAWRRPDRFPDALWPRFIEAVRRHDDGWIQEEERPTLDPEGRPYDFKSLPVHLHTAVWRRGVELVRRDDPYLGLLVAQHARWLYQAFVERDALAEVQVPGFIEEMDRAAQRERKRLEGGSPQERLVVEPGNLLLARRLLSFFDGLSLRLLGAIRMGTTEPLSFGVMESPLGFREGKGALEILPWPFQRPVIPLEVRAARVEKGPFQAPEDLASRMERAEEERLRWELRE